MCYEMIWYNVCAHHGSIQQSIIIYMMMPFFTTQEDDAMRKCCSCGVGGVVWKHDKKVYDDLTNTSRGRKVRLKE